MIDENDRTDFDKMLNDKIKKERNLRKVVLKKEWKFCFESIIYKLRRFYEKIF